MAGEGIKLFLSGDVLTASDLNGYLMDQVVSVFDDATDRNNAFGDGIPVANGGSGKPLLTAGRFCYLLDLQEVQYYNGSTWQAASQFSIENGSITEVKLASNAVTASKIASDAVIEAKLASGAVTESKIGSSAVTEAKIANSAVTTSKLAAGSVTESVLGSGAVTSDKIADGTIVNADINVSAAIDKTKISGTAITAADTGTVSTTMLANSSVTQAKIASRAIGSDQYDNITLNAQTGTTYTLVLGDAHKLVTLNNASAITLTIPTESVVAFDIGDQVNIVQLGAGQVTVGGAGVTLRAQGGKNKLNGQYAIGTLIKLNTNEWLLVGNTSA